MTGVRLHHSNRLEALAAELAHLMRTDPGDPFAPERIVVPHPTIGRWLSLELARRLGIAANVHFEQPAEFAWSIMRGVVPELSREQPYTPARLRWRIHDLLPGPAGEPGEGAARGYPASRPPRAPVPSGTARAWEGAVQSYLADGNPRKRLDLADRLARVFDQCLLYRPDWIREWESGAAPHWQARLWQCLVETDGTDRVDHWVNALDRFRKNFRDNCRDNFRSPQMGDTSASEPPESSPHGQPPVASPHPHPIAPSSPAGEPLPPPGWPRRASFFAVPALSTSYLELLCESARDIEIHLFLLNPCREYWGDIHSRREIDYRAEGADPDTRYFTEGNELLAAWGRAGRDMFDALVEVAGAEWEEHFVEPAVLHRLTAVQRDILDLRLASEAAQADASLAATLREKKSNAGTPAGPSVERAPEVEFLAAMPGEMTASAGRSDKWVPGAASSASQPEEAQPPATDDSIQIHTCHSPVREAEVLHDRLLALFDAHRDLEPADVLVLTPDLEVYGPAIEAVFAAAGRIPCNVARARGVESRTVRAFLDLLSLQGSRHGAEPVLAPLAAPAIRTRFGIGEADLPAIRDLVREAGIRWGVDEAHRGEEDLPETADHTWRQGLRRLLLGYAMADAGEPVAGLVPCPAGRGGFRGGEMNGELLGCFVSYCEEVFWLRHRLAGERQPAQWGKVLRDVIRGFLADGSGSTRGAGGTGGIGGTGGARDWPLARELAAEVGAIRALIRDFEREAARAESSVPFEVVLDVLRERACETAREAARLADGVTVASLGPGRIFPAGVVCVAGMNDGAFPRSPPTPSFDLIASGSVRRGDRDLRHEDRFAFLEALLAARRCFLVTYAGRGLRDDAPIPPSVLVDELKDYLGRRFPGAAVETLHPLQPFSPRYFVAPAMKVQGAAAVETAGGAVNDAAAETLFSYSRGMCEAAKTMLAGREGDESPARFAGVELPEPDESRRCVDLAELTAFFANPTRFFLRERLGVRLELDDLTLDDDEPFELDGLERYHLRSDIWDQMQAGVEPERAAVLLHGSGRLPQAELGRVVHERAREEVEPLEGRLAPHRAALDAPPREIDFDLGEFRIVGTVEHIEPGGRGPDGGGGSETGTGKAGMGHAEVGDAGVGQAGTGDAGVGQAGTGEAGVGRAGAGEAGLDRMVWWRIGSLRARDRIEIWLRQLAWTAAGHDPVEAVVVWLERGSWKSAVFPPPGDAHEQLGHWLRAWWRGLAAPLPFFPETSFEFARTIVRSGDDGDDVLEASREKSRNVWFGDQYRRGERLDPYLALVHDRDDPLTGGFEDLAVELLVPLAGAQR